MADMKITATIDRFEGDLAVLIEDSQTGREGPKADVERSLLPEEARAGDVLALSCSLGGGDRETVRRALSDARLDGRAGERRSERVKERIERLKRRDKQVPEER